MTIFLYDDITSKKLKVMKEPKNLKRENSHNFYFLKL